MPITPSISGSVADLFATLSLDTRPLSASLKEAQGIIKAAGADMSLSLGALENRLAQVTNELYGGAVATNAYQAALQAQGISTQFAAGASGDRAKALAAEAGALEYLITKGKEELAQEAYFMEQRAAYEAWEVKTRNERIALAEAQMAAELEADSIRAKVFAEDMGRMQAAALEDAQTTEARILLANQYAQAEVQSAAVVKAARKTVVDSGKDAASAMSGGLGIGPGGLTPRGYLGGAGAMAAGAALFGGAEILKLTAEFDDAMNKSLSIMGDVSDFQKNEMRDAAMRLSEQYGISSAEIVKSFYDMTSAGLDFQKSLQALPAVAQFAFTASKQGVMDMSKAAELLTTVSNAFAGQAGDIQHISDLLLKADQIAQGTGEQFAQALAGKGAGAVRILGKSAEEGLAILATLSTVGIRGANAQTAMVQILRDLPKEAEKYADTFIKINGVQMTYKELLYDSAGNMKNFADILQTLESLFAGASSEVIQHDLALLHLNDRTNQSLRAIVGMSAELREFQKKLHDAAGAAKEIEAVRLESLTTQLNALTQSAKNAAIEMGSIAIPWLKMEIPVLKVLIKTFVKGPMGEIEEIDPIRWFNDLIRVFGMNPPGFPNVEDLANPILKRNLPTGPRRLTLQGTGVVGSVGTPSSGKDEADEKRRQTILLDSERDHQLAMLDLMENSLEAQRKLHKISDDEALAQQLAFNQQRLVIQREYELKKLDLEAVAKDQVYQARVQAAITKAEDAKAALDQKYTNETVQRAADKHEKLLEDIRKFNQKMNEYDEKQLRERESIINKSEKLINDTVDKANDAAEKARAKGRDAAEEFIRLLALIAQIDRETASKKFERETDYNRRAQKIQDIIDKDEEASGKVTRSNASIAVARQLESEIKTIASGLSDLILEGGKFGDTMEKAMKQAVRAILQDLIQVGFGALLRTIFNTGTALNDLGRRLEDVWGLGGKKNPLPYGGGGGVTGSMAETPPFMQKNTGAVEKNTDKLERAADANAKATTATNSDIGVTGTATKAEQGNTSATNDNTAAIKLLTQEMQNNTLATINNTTALWANTEALWALTAALAYKALFPGGSGGGVKIGVNFGGGGGGFGYPGGEGVDPSTLGGNWDWLYNLPIGTVEGRNQAGGQVGLSMADGRRGVVIDMRNSTFHGQATEAQTTQMLNHVVDKLRLNRVQV